MWFWVEPWVTAVMVGAARAVPVVWMVPAFGGPSVPGPLRILLGLGLAGLCVPALAGQVPPHLGAWDLFLLVAREVAVGTTLGFAVATVFRAADSAGRLVDTLRGAPSELWSGTAGETASPLGHLFLAVTVVLFLELGGVGHLAAALARSYQAVPVAPVAAPDQLAGVVRLAVVASTQLMQAALGLAAPVLVATFLADLLLGMLGRVAPGLPLHFIGLPIKATLGVGVVLLSWGALEVALTGELAASMALLGQALRGWR